MILKELFIIRLLSEPNISWKVLGLPACLLHTLITFQRQNRSAFEPIDKVSSQEYHVWGQMAKEARTGRQLSRSRVWGATVLLWSTSGPHMQVRERLHYESVQTTSGVENEGLPPVFIQSASYDSFYVSKWKWKWKLLSCVLLFATPWTIQSMEFSRPEYWSG